MAFPRTKPDPATRGYGLEHRKARKAAARRHHPTDLCVRCGYLLGPMGPDLHYDHNTQRTGYLGFAHAHCNRKAGARKGARMGIAKQRIMRGLGYDLVNGCPICGRAITPQDKAAGRKYCSQRCGYIAHKNDPPKPRTPRPRKVQPSKPVPAPRYCTICGGLVPKGRRTRCSDACAVEHNARLQRELYRERQGLPPTWDKPTKTVRTWALAQ